IASFGSPADPGGFTIGPTFFLTLPGNVLLDPGPAAADQIPLRITFSQPVDQISLLFALNTANTATTLDLSTNAGGTTSATGTIPAGFSFPEGAISFRGVAFTTVDLSTSAFDFAIDDLVVDIAGGRGALQIVAAGGVASGTMVNSGGLQVVSSGAAATGTTIAFGGSETVSAGGSDTGATVGGIQDVFGTANSVVLISGGAQQVMAGGTASGTVIGPGANQN